MKIKFGTDGWRAIIANEFTVANVERVAYATAAWLKKRKPNNCVVVGYDCRFGGKLFAHTVAKIMGSEGIMTFVSNDFVSTPMISLGTIQHKADLGIIITASHNPPEYNGFKLKGSYGGPLLPHWVEEIENLIPDVSPVQAEAVNIETLINKGLLEYTDLEDLYVRHVETNFDLAAIKNSGIRLAYDAMYGAGQRVVQRILPDITFLHCDYNPSFKGQAPEPIHKNLTEFSNLIKNSGNIDCGLVTDGDADRIGLYNSKGEFVDSHHIILLLIYYLYHHKNIRDKICTAFSTTNKVAILCKHLELPLEVVKIGFKYICNVMLNEKVMVGGEESGGIAIAGHIPERDGIWIGLTLFEFMAKSGKNIDQLIEEVYAITGPFAFERSDLHLTEELKSSILANCKAGAFTSFGDQKVEKLETLDGFKYHLNENEWVMVRASGTEPILRVYAESSTREGAFRILENARKTLLGS